MLNAISAAGIEQLAVAVGCGPPRRADITPPALLTAILAVSRTIPRPLVDAVLPPLDLIDNTAAAVAAVGEVPGLGRMLADLLLPQLRQRGPATRSTIYLLVVANIAERPLCGTKDCARQVIYEAEY